MNKAKIILIIAVLLILAILGLFYEKLFITQKLSLNMKIMSEAFLNNGEIPEKYTCDGEKINPPLKITEIPENSKTLALIVDDPDAPAKTWVHWVVFNIPVSETEFEIEEGQKPDGIKGTNDFGKMNYGGPCPPSGIHHYFFKVYALDSEINLKEGATKNQIEKAMKDHVLDSAELIGLYR